MSEHAENHGVGLVMQSLRWRSTPGSHVLSMEQWDEPGVSKRSVQVAAGQTTFLRLEMREKAKKAMMVGGLVGGGLLGYAVASSIAKQENPTGLYEFVSVSDGRKANGGDEEGR